MKERRAAEREDDLLGKGSGEDDASEHSSRH